MASTASVRPRPGSRWFFRQHFILDFGVVNLETSSLIISQRCRTIQRTGVQVDAFRAAIPGLFEAFAQQDCAPAVTGELWQQSEILDFDVVTVMLEVEVPGGRALKVRHKQAQFGPVAPVAPLFKRPVQTVGPVPVAADGGVPEALEFWCRNFGFDDLEIRDLKFRDLKIRFAWVRFCYEFVAGIHLEMPDRVLHGSSVRDRDRMPQTERLKRTKRR
jgi:hypothetical protein